MTSLHAYKPTGHDLRRVTVGGRLLMGDFFGDVGRCRVHPAEGEPIPCVFRGDQAAAVLAALTRNVRVIGDAQEEEGRIVSLEIRHIDVVDEDPHLRARETPARSFHDPTPDIETLAREQGVEPMTEDRLNEIMNASLWPEDEAVDDFLAAREEWRRLESETGRCWRKLSLTLMSSRFSSRATRASRRTVLTSQAGCL